MIEKSSRDMALVEDSVHKLQVATNEEAVAHLDDELSGKSNVSVRSYLGERFGFIRVYFHPQDNLHEGTQLGLFAFYWTRICIMFEFFKIKFIPV